MEKEKIVVPELPAGYTVEAVFVLPILLGIIFTIMYVMFYLHDDVVLRGNMSALFCEIAEDKKIEKEDYRNYLSRGLWLMKPLKIEIKKKKSKISGKLVYRTEVKIPVIKMFMQEKQQISIEEEYSLSRPEQAKRYLRKKSGG